MLRFGVMRYALSVMAAAAGLAIAAVPALGHHSLYAVFDEDQTVTLKGVISKVEWMNPHVYLYTDVADAAGRVAERRACWLREWPCDAPN